MAPISRSERHLIQKTIYQTRGKNHACGLTAMLTLHRESRVTDGARTLCSARSSVDGGGVDRPPRMDAVLSIQCFTKIKGDIHLNPKIGADRQALHDMITRNHQCRSMWQLLKKVRHFMETDSPFPERKHSQAKV